MIAIRKGRPEDAREASLVLRRSIAELCAADHGGDAELISRWCANKTHEALLAWLDAPHIRLFVSELDGGIGCVGAISTDGKVLLNYVDPAARGRGHSRAMLRHMESELAGLGIGRATLDSTVTARAFYLSAGWQDAGAPETMFGLIGYPMAKDLVATANPNGPA